MKTKAQLEDDIQRWQGVNKYIIKDAKEKLKELKGSKPVKEKEVKVKPKPISKKDYEAKLFSMNKKEQVELLNELGAESIPRLEKDRVKLIIKLAK